IVRSYVIPALECMAQWHERDLTNSSVERITLPDSSVLVDYMLRKFTDVVKGMVVYPDHMRANLERLKGLVMSEHVMLALVDKGMGKDEAYRTVQAVAMKAFESGGDFRQLAAADPTISGKLSEADLAECFDYESHLKRIEAAYERVGI
ncbi:MAG: adenylosuccinate lyase, partial [Armatimonadota bacterium]